MRPSIGTALADSLVKALEGDCAFAAGLARLVDARPGSPVSLSAVRSGGPTGSAVRVARDFVRRGWLLEDQFGWRAPAANTLPDGLADFLAGAAAMRTAFPADSRADAVATMPAAPSAIGRALPATGRAHASVIPTIEAFERLADAATTSLTILTPFLNPEGLTLVLGFFQRTIATRRVLILRRRSATIEAIRARLPLVDALRLTLLFYSLPALDGMGYETFHAKIGVADNTHAYVGSANMLVFARQSMELGILVEGRAARVISEMAQAVERIALPATTR